jgi:polysaccharide biosynthesis/export protein
MNNFQKAERTAFALLIRSATFQTVRHAQTANHSLHFTKLQRWIVLGISITPVCVYSTFVHSTNVAIAQNGTSNQTAPSSLPVPFTGSTTDSTTIPSPTANPIINPATTTRSVSSVAPSSHLSRTASTIAEDYTLGVGDQVAIAIVGYPELSGEHRISANGFLDLPLVGSLPVAGKAIATIRQLIIQQYSQYLTRPPRLTLTLLNPRPVRVAVSGEVRRPGTYVTQLADPKNEIDNWQWPTLTQILQQAGGINQVADIRSIAIQRRQPDGQVASIPINLWELIQTGDIYQDISLRDGDVIMVPTASAVNPAEAIRIGSASFAPVKIQVQVVGEVVRPGMVEIPANTSLNQALLTAGGFVKDRARTSAVELVRLNPDGTVTQRTVEVDFATPPNETTNPLLRENDVVVVQRSRLSRTTDGIGVLLSPFSGILNLLQSIF